MPIQPPVHLGVSRWRRLASALGLVLTLAAAPASAAADTCPAPTFAGLIASVGAGTVGSCLGAAYQDPSSQATMQPTSGGLLIASGVGDWTAFTDGTSTWVDGPSGVVRQAASASTEPSGSAAPAVETTPSAAAAKRVHVLRHQATNAAARSAASTQAGTYPLLYWGGAVERSGSTNFAIYWQPSGTSMSAHYQSLINRFFSDLGNSAFYGLLSQYTDRSGLHLANTSSFGGAWTDTSAYPSTISAECAPRASNCLGDDDVQREVEKAIQANSWPVGGNNNYFVFVAQGEVTCAEAGECSDNYYCGYHSNFSGLGADLRYANMPYAQPDLCGTGGSSPNGDQDADTEINIVSHETFETVTDPDVGYGWVDTQHNEIGDKCAFTFGSLTPQGGDVVLNGHPYLVQQEWSNAANGCALSDGNPLNVSVAGAGSGTIGSSPSGISCPGTCSSAFPVGSTVTLTASPNAGSQFAGWGGACSGTGTCSVSLSTASNVTAAFTLAPVCTPRPPVTVSATPLGAGRLQVTVSATGTGVVLQTVQLGAASNALITLGGSLSSATNLSVPLLAGTTSTSFTLQRSAPGAAMTVPLTVTDSCGTWPTLVGGGPNAF